MTPTQWPSAADGVEARPSRRAASLASTPAPGGGIVGAVAGFDLPAGKHEVPGGELARAVPANQQNFERTRRATSEKDEGGGRDRRHRRGFDGHEAVCHDDAAAVMHFVEDRSL